VPKRKADVALGIYNPFGRMAKIWNHLLEIHMGIYVSWFDKMIFPLISTGKQEFTTNLF
jgi:hypothetical protein